MSDLNTYEQHSLVCLIQRKCVTFLIGIREGYKVRSKFFLEIYLCLTPPILYLYYIYYIYQLTLILPKIALLRTYEPTYRDMWDVTTKLVQVYVTLWPEDSNKWHFNKGGKLLKIKYSATGIKYIVFLFYGFF